MTFADPIFDIGEIIQWLRGFESKRSLDLLIKLRGGIRGVVWGHDLKTGTPWPPTEYE
jgi:hypothetical protein